MRVQQVKQKLWAQAKQIHSLLPISRQIFLLFLPIYSWYIGICISYIDIPDIPSYQPFPGKQDLAHIMVTWEGKGHNTGYPSPHLSTSFYCEMWWHRVWNIPVVGWGHVCWRCSYQLLVHPRILAGRAAWETEKAFTPCKHCSVTKTSLCYELSFDQKSKAYHHKSL